jgi:hypothetical protein
MVSRYHEQGPYKVFVTEGATHVDPNKEGHGHSNESDQSDEANDMEGRQK